MFELLVIKTGALGDVLRTTSILPGFRLRHPDLRVTWLTAPGARPLVERHPLVARVLCVPPDDRAALAELGRELSGAPLSRVLSLDDELPLCELATRVGDPARFPGRLSGAYLRGEQRCYTPDVAPWFDMGLLSVHGKARADQLKLANRESHAAIYARMFGIPMGEPELPLELERLETARARFRRAGWAPGRPLIGLNTGSGGRWESKKLPIERTVELARRLAAELGTRGRGRPLFALLGGPEEAERNRRLLAGLAGAVDAFDTGTDNSLLDFAALVDALDLLISSDSLALHMAVARRRPVLCFFAPTSAAEIELYERGAKVQSTAPDYCSYRKDADTATLTVERLLAPALALLARQPARLGPAE
jgi:heptosyltransferase-2